MEPPDPFKRFPWISRGTRCKQHLYSLSLNPPPEADTNPELLVEAVNRAEERLGLHDQPRAIVFHEKVGMDGQVRRHAHAVWYRIDADHTAETRWHCAPVFDPTPCPQDSTLQEWSPIKNKTGTIGIWHVRWDPAARRLIVVSPAGE